MTQDAYWVRRGIEDKERQKRQMTEQQRRQSERNDRAWRLAFERFPNLRCGTEANNASKTHPCPWLVSAVLNVWRRDGEGRAKPSVVLAERRRLLLARKPWAWDDVSVDPITSKPLMGRGVQQEERQAA